MTASSPHQFGLGSILERIGKILHGQYDEFVTEPVPRRWIELINYLNAKERGQPETKPAPEPTSRNTIER
jgi:hypothetical protein